MPHPCVMGEIAILKPRCATALVVEVLEALVGEDAFASFEGFAVPTSICDIVGAAREETEVLRRNTICPVLEFVVVPLSVVTMPSLKAVLMEPRALSDEEGLIHVQVAKAGRLVFGAYDNAHEDCTVLYPPYSRTLSEALLKSGSAESFVLSGHGA